MVMFTGEATAPLGTFNSSGVLGTDNTAPTRDTVTAGKTHLEESMIVAEGSNVTAAGLVQPTRVRFASKLCVKASSARALGVCTNGLNAAKCRRLQQRHPHRKQRLIPVLV